jgi:hypothetical protein
VSPRDLVPSDPARRVVKDYVYISRNKVEKFYDQIPKSWLSGIAARLSIVHQPLSLELRKQKIPKNLYMKLEAVLRHLEKESGIGSIERPAKYFAGQLPLYWGPYSDLRGKSGLVFFGGFTRSTVLGLGGSLKHVLGEKPTIKIHSRSDTPWLMDALLFDTQGKRLFPKPRNSTEQRMDYEISLQAVEVAVRETEKRRKPAELMEFVAIKLAQGRVTGEWDRQSAKDGHKSQKRVLLGSPIYLARV